MGAVYAVEATLKFKDGDPSRFCEIVRREVETRDLSTLYRKHEDLKTPLGCFQVITCPEDAKQEGDFFSAYFDATYSWEYVMSDIFRKAMDGLDDGTIIEIMPDNDVIRIYKKKGVVISEF